MNRMEGRRAGRGRARGSPFVVGFVEYPTRWRECARGVKLPSPSTCEHLSQKETNDSAGNSCPPLDR